MLCTKRGQFGGLPLQPLLPGETLSALCARLALALTLRGQKAILANQATSFVTSVADWREGIGACNLHDRDPANFHNRQHILQGSYDEELHMNMPRSSDY